MQTAPNMEEFKSRFADMENTYKDLLASANSTIANLNVLLCATQRELQKAMAESLELKKKFDAIDNSTPVETPPAKPNGADSNHAVN